MCLRKVCSASGTADQIENQQARTKPLSACMIGRRCDADARPAHSQHRKIHNTPFDKGNLVHARASVNNYISAGQNTHQKGNTHSLTTHTSRPVNRGARW